VGWLLLAVLVIMWAVFLLPSWGTSPRKSVKDFERNMDLLAGSNGQGRWIVTPQKGMAFIGPKARAQARARERRRRVFMVLIECIVLTGLIALVPPLRPMWYATAVLVVLLGVYCWLLVSIRTHGATSRQLAPSREAARPERPRPARQGYAADASARTARPAYNGLSAFGDDLVNIVVRPADQPGVARV
jgi:Flp pilus assembly protein TadB